MHGAQSEQRHKAPVRQVARCRRCGEEREGLTRFETMAYGGYPVGRPIHFCDVCDGELAASKRPLAVVLYELATG